MKRFLLVLLTALFCAPAAHAGPPTEFLKSQVKAVRGLLKTPVKKGSPEAALVDAKLMGIIDPVMDFDGLSERALRKHWPSLSAEQKKTFTDTFRQLVFRSYLDRVRSANENYTIVYEDEEKAGSATEVTAIAKTKKAEIELVFVLVKAGASMATKDVRIDEVSLVENYREQFNAIIAKEKFEGLIKKMTKKLNDLGGPVKIAGPAPAAAQSGAPASKGGK